MISFDRDLQFVSFMMSRCFSKEEYHLWTHLKRKEKSRQARENLSGTVPARNAATLKTTYDTICVSFADSFGYLGWWSNYAR